MIKKIDSTRHSERPHNPEGVPQKLKQTINGAKKVAFAALNNFTDLVKQGDRPITFTAKKTSKGSQKVTQSVTPAIKKK